MPDDGRTILMLLLAAFAAGAMNAIAGGGTLLTFPALTTVLSLAGANATSTIALLPGSVAGAWGYRSELSGAMPFLKIMLPPSFAGGLVGSLLVVAYPEDFGKLVPWLILTAAVLFLVQQPLNRWFKARLTIASSAPMGRGRTAGLVSFQFLTAVYGGYFGAGIGILMLTSLGFMNIGTIHRINAIKTVLASTINLVTVVVFLIADERGKVRLIDWRYAGIMAVAAIAGGYLGARIARRLPAIHVRSFIIVVAFGLAGYYFLVGG